MFKRFFDLGLSSVLLITFSPFIIVGFVASGFSLKRIPRVGLDQSNFDEFSFSKENSCPDSIVSKLCHSRCPVLFNIIKGDMSFVGPLPKSPDDPFFSSEEMSARCVVRPGLISLWWIRRRANIDYENEFIADMEYVEKHDFWSDVLICLRAIPLIFYGSKGSIRRDCVTLLGITLNNLTMSEAVENILHWLNYETSKQVCFVNADCVNIAHQNKQYLEVLQKADLSLADGIGLKLAGKLLRQEIAQNLCGTDMFPRICERLSGSDLKMYLLGARPEAVEGVVRWVSAHYPQVHVSGYHHGYFLAEQEPGIIKNIRESGAQLLLVAFGVPNQDIWIRKHMTQTGARVAMGVGGLFDFYSGRIPRAPLWVREIGMEWVYRLVQEPGRMWKRYLIGNFIFLWHVLRERFSGPRK
jgi:N-acetylglucosaminyldiphosphoundecaprenol N-acetyl-beta-D-mannosaminyltransferase